MDRRDARVENSSLDLSVRLMGRSGTEGAHRNPEVEHSEHATTMPFVNMCVPEREVVQTFCPMSLSGSEVAVPDTDAALAGTEGARRNPEAALSAAEGALRDGETAGPESARSRAAPSLSVAAWGISPVFQFVTVKNEELTRSSRRAATADSTRSWMFSTRGVAELDAETPDRSMTTIGTDARVVARSAEAAE